MSRVRCVARVARTVLGLLGVVVGGARGHADAPRVERVTDVAGLRRAAERAGPGTRIVLAGGVYEGGVHLTGVTGAQGRPVTLEAADPKNPPVFRGGGSGLQLSAPEHVEVVGLRFERQTGNGLNIDDGGAPGGRALHVTLRDLSVSDTGPEGNCDGIKLSGVAHVAVTGCVVERWGRGGSAVDMVGCRDGRVEGCTFRHDASAAQASGVQMKGGTRDVTVRRCRFEHAGARAVNAGGSTGLAYFRPPLATWSGPRWEAHRLTIEGNTFVGGQTPVAFVGVDGATFRFNTVYLPGRWTARVLQETRAEGFVPCRDVTFSDNLVVFRTDAWSEGGVNVGSGTAPETFRFARNHWFALDAPERTQASVRLPTPEAGGVYGEDPRLVAPASGDLAVRPGSPAARVGAHALVPGVAAR